MSIFLSVDFGLPGATDTAGVRPYTGTNPQWNNTSIFLSGGVSQTQTKVGQATTVKVRVSNANRTTAIEDVRVDAYVMNPFVGPFQPFNARRKLTGFAASIEPGSGGTSSADPHVITCQIQDPVLGAIPWTPTAADIEGTSNGHLCLVANAYSVPDGGPVPDTTTYDVINDPHQGQRNIAVLKDATVNFTFQVFGPENGGEFALDLLPLRSRDLGIGEQWLLRSLREITIPEVGRKRLVLAGTRGRPDVPIAFSRKAVQGTLSIDGLGELDVHQLLGVGKRVAPMLADRPALRARDWGAGRLVTTVGREGTFAQLALKHTGVAGALQAFDVVARDAAGRPFGGLRILNLDR
ncbi:hypothetical protein [Cellulomonas fengjieae]|uniref:Uncharacterized protein n=1 Tax=Cellulomonas fengjieae TaxID=2819978 RepID=A0ABS3SGK2_9CELL|nr:hypothetical protein [Cellulomonas fengjieae]MBO3084873.1 hypothetical protein [Cellulomonas fengjieae]QVI66813.1 hypothetical protein KG102_04290 [Cellulomonas fengjieae]